MQTRPHRGGPAQHTQLSVGRRAAEMMAERMHVDKGHARRRTSYHLQTSTGAKQQTTRDVRQCNHHTQVSYLAQAASVLTRWLARDCSSSAVLLRTDSAVSTSERQPKLQQARTFAAPASQRAARELPRRGVSQSVGRTGRLEGSFRAARVEWPRGQGPRQSAPAAVRGTQRVGGGEYNVQAQDSGLGHYQMR